MSYTRPNSASADASWQGRVAYTRPLSTDADASWYAGLVGFAQGFSPTRFGAPLAASQAQRFDASGFLATNVGVPRLVPVSQGFSQTRFGIPIEPNVAWPGDGSLPGWGKGSAENPWEYDDSDGARVTGCMRATIPDFAKFSTLVSPELSFAAEVHVSFATKYGLTENSTFTVSAVNTATSESIELLNITGSDYSWAYYDFTLPAGSWQLLFSLSHLSVFGFSMASVDDFRAATTPRIVPAPPPFVAKADAIRPVARFGVPIALGITWYGAPEGFKASRFGVPYLFVPPHVEYRTVASARQFKTTKFGTPSTPVPVTATQRGWRVTRFGTPILGTRPVTKYGRHRGRLVAHAVSATPLSTFGTPTGQPVHRAAGARFGSFGAPTHVETHVAASLRRRPRFGTPNSRIFAHITYGFSRHGRFGQPTAHTPMFYPEGFYPTRFGEHAGAEYHYALHIPPETRFGTPLMKRHV